jgi:glyoxylase-like metal-dependent hydrolase (beta-lactamase superfamily II)
MQVHRYDEHTYILRQGKQLTREAPFLYLLFGSSSALLLDTGAVADQGRMPLRPTVDRLVDEWLRQHPREGYRLVVAHTHGHNDHVAGDAQFADRASTTVVGKDVDSVRAFFGFTRWPRQTVELDLGGRVLEVIGCPGHHESSIAVFDPWTGFLLSGDTVYPGRLYVQDAPAFRASLDALVAMADIRPVTAVVGGHVEMTRTKGVDYPMGTRYQPDEPPLPMTVGQLREVQAAAHEVGDRAGVHPYGDFVIFNGVRPVPILMQLGRRLARSFRLMAQRPPEGP